MAIRSEPGTYCLSASSAELKTSLSNSRASATSLERVEDGSTTYMGYLLGLAASAPKARGRFSLCSNQKRAAQVLNACDILRPGDL